MISNVVPFDAAATRASDSRPTASITDEVIRRPLIHRAIGTERIAVILCIVPTDTTVFPYSALARRRQLNVHLSPTRLAELANQNIAPYFRVLSRGRYSPTFHAQGALRLEPGDGPRSCYRRARDAKGPEYSNFLAVDTSRYTGGLASPGISPYVIDRDITTLDSENHSRGAYVGGGVFASSLYRTARHEIGHTLHWPHSYTDDDNEYGNPLDLMSGGHLLPLAVNALASGWIDDEHVVVHQAGTTRAVVDPLLSGGRELIVVRSATHRNSFLTIEHRPNVFDGEPAIAVHRIDQPDGGCGFHRTDPCLSIERRQRPAVGRPGRMDHALRVGESLVVDGVIVSVEARIGDSFDVTVRGLLDGPTKQP